MFFRNAEDSLSEMKVKLYVLVKFLSISHIRTLFRMVLVLLLLFQAPRLTRPPIEFLKRQPSPKIHRPKRLFSIWKQVRNVLQLPNLLVSQRVMKMRTTIDSN